ncbi:GNAT family N-acetyltransferase [Rhodanobacter sp. L36]|uniref:GNAT family N-acetyltransferase n=1 Tax=Rhodanobacter sp. L36 TaxID=1747221 RepID=UPI001C2062D4|nr:GNAT family N-acetyltransferase [Rhodanobacter sp. L36]
MKTNLENGRTLLTALKLAAGPFGSELNIPVGCPVRALLRPVATTPENVVFGDIVAMSEWRNRFVTHFLTEFLATPERTKSWLTDVVGPNGSKILFMVDLPDGTTTGHVGIDFINWETGYAEADAIVRGGEAPKGVMREALLTAISWAKNQLGIKAVGVRVRSNNPALGFYHKIGFTEIARYPLRRIDEPDLVRWVEDIHFKEEEAEHFLVHMMFDSQN